MVKSKHSMTASSKLESFADFEERHLGDSDRYQLDRERAADLAAQRLNGNCALQHYIDDNGLYGKATVMDGPAFDEYVKQYGLKVIYRGMPDGEHLTGMEKHANFMYGDKYYVGNGIFGDGMYFGGKKTAEQYATTGYYDGEGAVMKAALKPNARTVSHASIKADIDEKYPVYKYSEGMLSVYARSLGYDAITTPDGNTIVLNRDSLVISADVKRMELYKYA